MNPVAFNLFGIAIRWYGIIITAGILLAILTAYYRAESYEINFDDILDIFIIALPCAIIGARLYYVIFNWSYYQMDILKMINIREGGLAIHGGLLGAFISSYFIARKKSMNYINLLDLVAPSIILGQAIGRWGNFFNMEAHGEVVSKSFISHFPSFIQKGMLIDGSYYNPTFLYESMWNILVFIILLIVSRNKTRRGLTFGLYLILYSIGRFVIEGLRTDSLMLGPIRVAQLISLIFIVVGLIIIFIKFPYKEKRV
ncbi:MAG TPA: prolipoprotein diacylglyceryl transferase [Clostridiaceae bacterium]